MTRHGDLGPGGAARALRKAAIVTALALVASVSAGPAWAVASAPARMSRGKAHGAASSGTAMWIVVAVVLVAAVAGLIVAIRQFRGSSAKDR
jgi:hypothetical protein